MWRDRSAEAHARGHGIGFLASGEGLIGLLERDSRGVLASITLLVLMVFSPPLFFIERYSLLSVNKIVIFGAVLVLGTFLLRKFSIPAAAAELATLQLFQSLFILSLAFVHAVYGYAFDGGYFNLMFQVLAALALFVVLAAGWQLNLLARLWVNVHLVMGFLGSLVFIAGLLLNLQPLETFGDRPYYDFGLAYTNVFYSVGGANLIRVAGFYDEPGTFAFYTTFAVLLARTFSMPRWKECLLLVFGLTSLSLAFSVVVILWLIFSLRRIHIVYLALVLILGAWGVSRMESEVRDRLYAVTIGRADVSSGSDRVVAGDNRSAIMRENYEAFLRSPLIGHGVHYEDYVRKDYHHSFIANPMAPLATHGLIGTVFVNLHVLVFFLLLVYANSLKVKDRIFIGLALLATLAQRPITINGMGYILFFLMMVRFIEGAPPLGYLCNLRPSGKTPQRNWLG